MDNPCCVNNLLSLLTELGASCPKRPMVIRAEVGSRTPESFDNPLTVKKTRSVTSADEESAQDLVGSASAIQVIVEDDERKERRERIELS